MLLKWLTISPQGVAEEGFNLQPRYRSYLHLSHKFLRYPTSGICWQDWHVRSLRSYDKRKQKREPLHSEYPTSIASVLVQKLRQILFRSWKFIPLQKPPLDQWTSGIRESNRGLTVVYNSINRKWDHLSSAWFIKQFYLFSVVFTISLGRDSAVTVGPCVVGMMTVFFFDAIAASSSLSELSENWRAIVG